MANDDLIMALERGTQKGGDALIEVTRRRRDATVRPALAKNLTTQQQLADYATFLDPVIMQTTIDEVTARYNLGAEKPVPRRIVQYVQRMEKKRRAEEKKNASNN